MIIESEPWRKEIVRHADIADRWSERSGPQAEFYITRSFLFTATTIRVLLDRLKLANDIQKYQFHFDFYDALKSTSKTIRGRLGDIDPNKNFQMKQKKQKTFSANEILNLIIHNRNTYFCIGNNNRINGVLLSSDRYQDKMLIEVKSAEYFIFVRKSALSYVNKMHLQLVDGTVRVTTN
jgi:hypothetical protein